MSISFLPRRRKYAGTRRAAGPAETRAPRPALMPAFTPRPLPETAAQPVLSDAQAVFGNAAPRWATDPAAVARLRDALTADRTPPLDLTVPVEVTVPAVIGDSLPYPEFPEQAAPEPEAPGTLPVLYTGPEWTRALCLARLRSGEWGDYREVAERAHGTVAASAATAHRHVSEAIMTAAEQFCRETGRPGEVDLLLRKIRSLNLAAGRAS